MSSVLVIANDTDLTSQST